MAIEYTITRSVVSCYTKGSWPLITKIEWCAGPLRISVLRNFPNLKRLSCWGNDLNTLKGIEVCTQLRYLNCCNNKLKSLKGIEGLAITELHCADNLLQTLDCLPTEHLRTLFCGKNSLESLEGISLCTNLSKLGCYQCSLRSLAGIESLSKLIYIDCDYNELESLSQVASCINLEVLYCRTNRLTTLEGIEACTSLQALYCQHNRLTSLTGIESCIQLQSIACHNNDLTSLSPIAYLRDLRSIEYRNNAIVIQTPQIQRILDRIQANRDSSIYADNQNVHDSHVQKSVCDSVRNLLSDTKPTFSIEHVIESGGMRSACADRRADDTESVVTRSMGSGLDTRAVRLLLEYCADETVHSIHNLTYAELLMYVWARICRSEHKAELLTILAEQLTDSECKCFTGRFNRTLSVLVGFYPDITITISDSSRISAIILAIRTRIEPYDPILHQQTAQSELMAAGYTLIEIQPWLDAITDLEVD